MEEVSPNYLNWSDVPYAGEDHPPSSPVEPTAGSWTMHYIRPTKRGGFETLVGKPIRLAIQHPNRVDFQRELTDVHRALDQLTPHQKTLAEYWGAGPPTKQWTPIVDRLIDTYQVEAPRAARILACFHAGINDAFVVAWTLKYRWLVARPNQYDQELVTAICTPEHPTYPSGHAVVSGAAEEILSYFFPAERKRIRGFALENAQSRLYGGVHFPSDNNQGLRVGRQIGRVVVDEIRNNRDSDGHMIDVPYRRSRHAELMPPPYEQVIPFDFNAPCKSLVEPAYVQKPTHLPKPKLYI
jgi:hypothetical protein